jgi:hypothetical protein
LTENASIVPDAVQCQNDSSSSSTALAAYSILADPNGLSASSLDNNAKKLQSDLSGSTATDASTTAATLIYPSGTVKTGTVSFAWKPVGGSTSYHLWIDRGKAHVFDRWYPASEVTSGSICSTMPPEVLDKGIYFWRVLAKSDSGAGPWSSSMRFSVGPLAPPGKPSLISPSGTISNRTPTYTWNAVAGADRYLLIVDSPPRRNQIKLWFNDSDVKSGSICSATPKKALDTGIYT